MNINRSFWKDKRIFLTGHTGFKGTWLSLWLQSLGAHVTGCALPPASSPNLFDIARVADGMDSKFIDIREADSLRHAMIAAQPDIVLHLAAQALVRYSYEAPVETFDTNVMGTVHLLEAARQIPSVRSIVVISSDKCYENREQEHGYIETDAMGGHDPYSSSKGCTELVAAAYRNSFFSGENPAARLASARAGNVIGGGDWAADRIVPDTMNAFMKGRAVHLRNPDAVRPWQHVLEPRHGYLMLAECLWHDGANFAEGWNFGPYDDSAQPVGQIVDRMGKIWGGDASSEFKPNPNAVHEATLLRLNIEKAETRLDWHPKLSLEKTLDWTVEWYRAFSQGKDMRSYTLDQIKQYENLKSK